MSTLSGILVFVALVVLVLFGYWFYTPKNMNLSNSEMLRAGGLEVNALDVDFEEVRGYYATPTEDGEYPGVVMIHEWWGLNEQIKDTARDLAAQGYRVLAVDLFHKPAATERADAQAQVAALDQTRATAELRAATEFLRGKGAQKVASLGWCFGGAQSLRLALSGEPLNATVIYYGSNPPTDSEGLSVIKWPLLGIYGAEDTGIPTTTVQAFDAALTKAGVKHEVHIYPGVGHAFANPSGANYAPEQTKDSWQKTLKFLSDNLK